MADVESPSKKLTKSKLRSVLKLVKVTVGGTPDEHRSVQRQSALFPCPESKSSAPPSTNVKPTEHGSPPFELVVEVPAGHSPAHSVAPTAPEYKPASQFEHGVPGSLSLSARPAAQLTQLVALSDAAGVRVPFGHRVAPTLLEYRPASHSIQGVPTSLSSSAQPATHFSQLVALSD